MNDRARAVMILGAFIACCFNNPAVAGGLLLTRYFVQEPEKDPVYRAIVKACDAIRPILERRRRRRELLRYLHRNYGRKS